MGGREARVGGGWGWGFLAYPITFLGYPFVMSCMFSDENFQKVSGNFWEVSKNIDNTIKHRNYGKK
jgi:hypothetical protein